MDYAKDDPRDAAAIGYLLRNGQFTETQLLTGVAGEMRQYATRHWRLQHELSRAQTVLRQTLDVVFPEVNQLFGDLQSETLQAVLHSQLTPATLASLSWEAVEQAVRQRFSGHRLAVSKVRRLYQQASASYGVPATAAWSLQLEQQLRQLELLQQHRQQVEQGLCQQFQQLPAAPALYSIGMGALLTPLIVAEIGDLSHFHNASQLVKLAGIQPTPKQSGDYTRQRTPMAHKGRPHLRTYLFWACLRLVQQDAAFAAAHQRYCTRMTKLQSLGALMNQLLHILWALNRTHETYTPTWFK